MQMKLIVACTILVCSFTLFAEIYSSDLEKHENVLTCRDRAPNEHVGTVYLDREMLGEAISIEGLIEALLLLDVERKSSALESKIPDDLHESEGARYELRLAEYLESSLAQAATCAADFYRDGDEIRPFYNSGIAPSWQEGFVILRDGSIVVRIVTDALYVD